MTSSLLTSKPWALRLLLSSFRRDDRGATAVEFGLLSIPFFFMMMMIVEMSMVFWTRQVLQEATAQMARSILTGESRTLFTGSPAAQTAAFRDAICARMRAGADCPTRLFVDVQNAANFPTAAAGSLIAGQVINPATFAMRPVAPLEIAIVRTAYTMPVFTAGFFGDLGRLSNGQNVLEAVVAFRAEPFIGATPPSAPPP